MHNTPYKILYYVPYPTVPSPDRFIHYGWRYAFLASGNVFYTCSVFDDFSKLAMEIRPDIVMLMGDFHNNKNIWDALLFLKTQNTKICFWIDFYISRVCHDNETKMLAKVGDVFFGEHERGSVYLPSLLKNPAIKPKGYITLAHAANKQYHYPTDYHEQYAYDIVYMGTKLPEKKWFFKNILIPLTKRYHVGIFGACWTVKDQCLRVAWRLAKCLHWAKALDFISTKRVTVPEEDENKLYSSAKISLNFHGRAADNTQPHYVVNQRTFKISASGGFQICDDVPAIRQYFNEDELVMAECREQHWFELIQYYLEHPLEREIIRQNGIKRALTYHTYEQRVEQLLRLCFNPA